VGVSSSSLFTRDSRQLLALGAEYRDQPVVRAAQQRLDHAIRKLIRKILGQLHSRAAAAVNCLLVLLLGAVLSLKMRGAMPLVVYFWTFLLAALSVIIVQSGRTLMERADTGLVLGLIVLWSGTAMLAGATSWLHLRLRRH
jgi:lipopolysaccharide export LptBFGC system permease protein LptF